MAFHNWFKSRSKILVSRIVNLFFLVILAFILAQRLPLWWTQWQMEQQEVGKINLQLLNGKTFEFESGQNPLVLVFWATWCGPCKVELDRLANMVAKGEVSGEQIMAVVGNEDLEIVNRVVKDRAYPFLIGLDRDETLAVRFKVQATPTVVLISRKGSIDWMTTGISPSLEWRINRLLSHSE